MLEATSGKVALVTRRTGEGVSQPFPPPSLSVAVLLASSSCFPHSRAMTMAGSQFRPDFYFFGLEELLDHSSCVKEMETWKLTVYCILFPLLSLSAPFMRYGDSRWYPRVQGKGEGEESMAAICRRLHDGGDGMVSDAGKGVVTIYRARLLSSLTVLLATGCASVTARTPPGAGMRKEWGGL